MDFNWTSSAQLQLVSTPVVSADNAVFIGSDTGVLYAFDGPSGTVKWYVQWPEGDRPVVVIAALAGL